MKELGKRNDIDGTIARVFEDILFNCDNLAFVLPDEDLMRVFETIKEVGMT